MESFVPLKINQADRIIGRTFPLGPFPPPPDKDWKNKFSDFLEYMGKSAVLKSMEKEAPEVVPSMALLGIEVEVENIQEVTAKSTPKCWNVTIDNSLRNDGREFVSLPLTTDDVRKAVLSLFSLFELQKKPVEFTWRTSIHVHCNIRDLPIENFATMMMTYLIFEDLLFQFVGDPLRRKGNYCVPVTESYAYSLIGKFLHGDISLKELSHNWHKYSAFNVVTSVGNGESSKNAKGTVEFRQMGGTKDVEKLLNWINLILRLYNYAEKTSLSDFAKRFIQLESFDSYIKFRNEVFKEHAGLLLVNRDWKQLYYSGIAFVKECFSYPFRIELPSNQADLGIYSMLKKRTAKARAGRAKEIATTLKKLEEKEKELTKVLSTLQEKSSSSYKLHTVELKNLKQVQQSLKEELENLEKEEINIFLNRPKVKSILDAKDAGLHDDFDMAASSNDDIFPVLDEDDDD